MGTTTVPLDSAGHCFTCTRAPARGVVVAPPPSLFSLAAMDDSPSLGCDVEREGEKDSSKRKPVGGEAAGLALL